MQGNNDGDLELDESALRSQGNDESDAKHPRYKSCEQKDLNSSPATYEEYESSRYQALYKALKKSLDPEKFELD